MAIYHLRLVFSVAGAEGQQQYASQEIEPASNSEAISLAKSYLDTSNDIALHIAMVFAPRGSIIWSLRAPGAEIPPAAASNL